MIADKSPRWVHPARRRAGCSLTDVDADVRRDEARRRARHLIAQLPADDEACGLVSEHAAWLHSPLLPETIARIEAYVAQRSPQSQE